jgi:hypothetical protein
MRDFDRTVISQYSDSPTLVRLITNLNIYFDPQANLQSFYDLIWNVDTAEGYGLDVWGRIVGISRFVRVPTDRWFGFGEAGTLNTDPWDQSAFYNGQELFRILVVDDESYRRMILTKAATNITDCSIPAINKILTEVAFPNRGKAYVTDGRNVGHDPWFGFKEAFDGVGWDQGPFGDLLAVDLPENMTMTYVFEFELTETEDAMVRYSGVLPKGAGVRAFVQVPSS